MCPSGGRVSRSRVVSALCLLSVRRSTNLFSKFKVPFRLILGFHPSAMRLFLPLLLLIFLTEVRSKGVYLVEERNGKTYTQPLTSPSPVVIGEQIRELFDFDVNENEPVGTTNKMVSAYMKSLYQQLENFENGGKHEAEEEVHVWLSADRIVSHLAEEVSHRMDDGSYQIRFSRNSVPSTEGQSILRAQLRVKISGIVSPAFFYIQDTSLPGNTVLVSSDDPNVVTDVTTLVDKWSHLQASMLPMITARASTEHELNIEAFLVIALKDENGGPSKRRSRRAATAAPLAAAAPMRKKAKRSESAYYEKPDANAFCQRKGLYVDFDILGWKKWVIAPEGISIFYCSGACSAPFHKTMNATAHAIVQSLIYVVRPNTTTAAQCAPSHLSSFKILFVDQKKEVQIKRYRDMVVEECGCH